jgi:hypothetical protein
LLVSLTLKAQNNEYSTMLISDSLKENANAIVRLNKLMLLFLLNSMTINTKRVITVLNEKDFPL